MFPLNDPSISPSENPTMSPSVDDGDGLPSQCENTCDGWSVQVMDTQIDGEEVCLTYSINRLFMYGVCEPAITQFILGFCDDDDDTLDIETLDEIIKSFTVLSSNRRRRRLESDSDSDSESESESSEEEEEEERDPRISSSRFGIKIQISIDESLLFRLCLRNIFDEASVYSNNVLFKYEGDRRRIDCDEVYLDGLPCIDGSGSGSGNGVAAVQNAMSQGEIIDNHPSSSSTSSLSTATAWQSFVLYSIFAVFVLLTLLSLMYYFYYWYCGRRRESKEKTQNISKNVQMITTPIDE